MLERWRFPLLLVLALCGLLSMYEPYYGGDVVEYTVATVAIADHGSPDIRLGDIARVRALLPGMFAEPYDLLERGMRAGEHPDYFDGLEPQNLAAAIQAWLQLPRAGKAPPSTGMARLARGPSARQRLAGPVRPQWCRGLPRAG